MGSTYSLGPFPGPQADIDTTTGPRFHLLNPPPQERPGDWYFIQPVLSKEEKPHFLQTLDLPTCAPPWIAVVTTTWGTLRPTLGVAPFSLGGG